MFAISMFALIRFFFDVKEWKKQVSLETVNAVMQWKDWSLQSYSLKSTVIVEEM